MSGRDTRATTRRTVLAAGAITAASVTTAGVTGLAGVAGIGGVTTPALAAGPGDAGGGSGGSTSTDDPAVRPANRPATLRTGAQLAADNGWKPLGGGRIGVFSNPTGILSDARHIVDDMVTADGLEVVAAFGPEHGFRGSAQAGGSEGDSKDPRTGIPVYDAYGANADKLAELFTKSGAETIVFDIQDVGARFYTYIWSLYQAMVGAAKAGVRFVVLDRPNPIGGRADGALMTQAYETGVGLRPIVQQHGMTMGELARFYNGEFVPADTGGRQVELEVVALRGWAPDSRAQDFAFADLPWVPPSPNIPTPDSASVYVGTCYFEGTNLSEGRGTTRPFEFVGAPYLDYHWGDRLNARELPGVRFREAYFTPTFDKYVGELCAGVQLHVTDLEAFRPIETGVAMLIEAKRYADFAWRKDTYDPPRPYWIDKLSGSTRLRTMIDAGAELDEVVGAWSAEVRDFERTRQAYLLYPGRRA